MILPLKVWLQSDDSLCGPASIKMIADWYNLDYTEAQLAKLCNHSYEKGCTNEDIVRTLTQIGFNPKLVRESSIEQIEEEIKKGKPVIIDWFIGDPANGHSSVVIGYDDANLIILDPLKVEPVVVDKTDFLICWFDYTEVPITRDNLELRVMITL